MSKKKKKEMGNIEIKDAKDLEQEENTEQETAGQSMDEPEEPEIVEEAEAAEEEVTETREECGTDECVEDADDGIQESDSDPEGKTGKKERKLKWAKAAGKEAKEIEEAAKAVQAKLAEANDRYARLFAEFDNFRKRSEKEKAQRYDYGAKDIIERILPVIDNFERGLSSAAKEGKEEDSFVKGMEMTYKQLMKVLEDVGVKPIEAVGQEFNPEYHNAVMHVDDPEAGENVIVEEFQKGYMYKDHVVRYSMVKVAN